MLKESSEKTTADLAGKQAGCRITFAKTLTNLWQAQQLHDAKVLAEEIFRWCSCV